MTGSEEASQSVLGPSSSRIEFINSLFKETTSVNERISV